MLVGAQKNDQAWKKQSYPVPTPSRSSFRWKARALRRLYRWNGGALAGCPATLMVPALYNFMPAESVALGWFNEIDALVTIRQRMSAAARITGWDAFTFHTLHNADSFFDSAINAMRETWMKEGSLLTTAVREAGRRFGKPFEYHRLEARLVENLVLQSSLLDWAGRAAGDFSLRVHVIGTALLSALVSTGSISFPAAVESATKLGSRWDETLRGMAASNSDQEAGWTVFRQVKKLIEGRTSLSMGVATEDLPAPDAPARPFWYSPTMNSEPMLITTAQEAANALQTLNLGSWSGACDKRCSVEEPVRGWLMSPLHPMARICRWSVSNYLLATPLSAALFLEHIASLQPALESLAAVENEGHRPLIGQLHVHHRLK
jgi:hypothetical protein